MDNVNNNKNEKLGNFNNTGEEKKSRDEYREDVKEARENRELFSDGESVASKASKWLGFL